MIILLTGAEGFTGRHFRRAAESCGHQVIPLAADLRDKTAVGAAVREMDYSHVVHLAALSFVGHEDLSGFYDVNLFGTLNLLDALQSSSTLPERVLIASSANVYGNCSNSPIAESAPLAPVNHYATSKLAMEWMSRTYQDALNLIFVRPFNYTGVGQNPSFLIPKLVDHFKARAQKIELGNLDVIREYNDVREVCDAYLHLLVQGQVGETYNVCSGRGYSLNSVLDSLRNLTGHSMAIEVNPKLVRKNEVKELLGDPRKLAASMGGLKSRSLSETLSWMLNPDSAA